MVPGFEPESSLVKSLFQLPLNLRMCSTTAPSLRHTEVHAHLKARGKQIHYRICPSSLCKPFILLGNFCLGRAHKTLPAFIHWNDASSIWPTQSPLILFITKVTLTTGSWQIPVSIMHFKWCAASDRGQIKQVQSGWQTSGLLIMSLCSSPDSTHLTELL